MRTVMIVEDDVDIRQLFAEVLEADGYRVIQAGNGREALDLLRAGADPALIFLDLMMPVMSGAELLEILQDDSELARVPVVVVSAFAEGTVKGVKRFVQKPVNAAQLQAIASDDGRALLRRTLVEHARVVSVLQASKLSRELCLHDHLRS